jgi:hypothetical protein
MPAVVEITIPSNQPNLLPDVNHVVRSLHVVRWGPARHPWVPRGSSRPPTAPSPRPTAPRAAPLVRDRFRVIRPARDRSVQRVAGTSNAWWVVTKIDWDRCIL